MWHTEKDTKDKEGENPEEDTLVVEEPLLDEIPIKEKTVVKDSPVVEGEYKNYHKWSDIPEKEKKNYGI